MKDFERFEGHYVFSEGFASDGRKSSRGSPNQVIAGYSILCKCNTVTDGSGAITVYPSPDRCGAAALRAGRWALRSRPLMY